MNVLINIPDHLYDLLKDLPSDSNEGTIENVLMKAVENGMPLEQIQVDIYEEFMTIDGGVHDKSALKCMEIIDKYKGDKE